MEKFACLLVVLASIAGLSAATAVCSGPEVSATSYTSPDATVLTNIGFVAEFTLKCGNGVQNPALFAELNGKTQPVARIGPNKYQVSWAEDVKKARRGDYTINIYDEENFAAVRKAMRNNEDISTVKALATVVLNYPGSYQGPWVNSEFMAFVLSIGVWYAAFSAKSKLLA
uniref:Translocon-associated protein subunit delta n=1 Tax=Anthurium amnicola TaxID=1678845 RepID=A0A1D1Y7W0_9ARAE